MHVEVEDTLLIRQPHPVRLIFTQELVTGSKVVIPIVMVVVHTKEKVMVMAESGTATDVIDVHMVLLQLEDLVEPEVPEDLVDLVDLEDLEA